MKTKEDITVRKVKNNGSDAWVYRGTEKQIMKACSKYKTEDDFKTYVLSKINDTENKNTDSVIEHEPTVSVKAQTERSEDIISKQPIFVELDNETESTDFDFDFVIDSYVGEDDFGDIDATEYMFKLNRKASLENRFSKFTKNDNRIMLKKYKEQDDNSESLDNFLKNKNHKTKSQSRKLTKDGW